VRGLVLLAALLAPLLALGACGRVGPPRPPGPASDIVYPRQYPYFPRGTDGSPGSRGDGAPIEQGDRVGIPPGGGSVGAEPIGGSPQAGPR
jgi:hypothetical protein